MKYAKLLWNSPLYGSISAAAQDSLHWIWALQFRGNPTIRNYIFPGLESKKNRFCVVFTMAAHLHAPEEKWAVIFLPSYTQGVSGQISDLCISLPRNSCILLLLSYLVWENSKSVKQNSFCCFLGEVGRPVINHLSWNAFISLPFLIPVQQC